VGAGLLLLLYAACALFNARLGYQGNESRELEALIWSEFRGVVLGQVARLWLAYAAVGAALGTLFAAGAVAARRTRRGVALTVVAGVLAVEALVVAADVAHHPHLYAATLFGRAGWLDAALAALGRLPPQPLRLAAAGVALGGLLPLLWRAGAWALGTRRGLRHGRGLALAAGAAVLLALVSRAGAGGPPRAARGPNLVILASDSLRADVLEGEEGARLAPHLARLAREGTRFSSAVVELPRTAPSWTTLLTSQPAAEHGLSHTLPRGEVRLRPRVALPGVLAEAGWHTAVVSDYAGDVFRRIPFGFQRVDAPDFTLPDLIRQRMLVTHVPLLPWTALAEGLFPERRQMPELTDPAPLLADALAALDAAQGHERFALVVFASPTHFPYGAPHPHALEGIPPAYRGKWLFGATPPMEAGPAAGPPTTGADVQALRAGYRNGVAAFDALAGGLLASLEARGLADSTAVVLLSDHGEHLEEEGMGMGHGEHLWGRASLRVPLVVRMPGKVAAGREVAQRVRSLDVAPTLLELLGQPLPPSFRGRSLVPLLRPEGPEPLPDLPALVETDLWFSDRDGARYQGFRLPYPWVYGTGTIELPRGDIALKPEWEETVERAKHRGMYLGRWKLLELPTPGGVRAELYDVQADPEERHDVAAAHPDVVERLRRVHAEARQRLGSM
jgi:arylsulfatase A-like enzyme